MSWWYGWLGPTCDDLVEHGERAGVEAELEQRLAEPELRARWIAARTLVGDLVEGQRRGVVILGLVRFFGLVLLGARLTARTRRKRRTHLHHQEEAADHLHHREEVADHLHRAGGGGPPPATGRWRWWAGVGRHGRDSEREANNERE